MLTVLPIRYVADLEASTRFYEGLGLRFEKDASFDVWSQFSAGAGAVGIHDAAASKTHEAGAVGLGFVTDEPVDTIARRLTDAGYACEVTDENFGRSVRVVDPDGVTVQIQNVDPKVSKHR